MFMFGLLSLSGSVYIRIAISDINANAESNNQNNLFFLLSVRATDDR